MIVIVIVIVIVHSTGTVHDFIKIKFFYFFGLNDTLGSGDKKFT